MVSKILPFTIFSIGNEAYEIDYPSATESIISHTLVKKIDKMQRHILHFTEQQAKRKTHGGKRFRVKKTSLKEQKLRAEHRLYRLCLIDTGIRLLEEQIALSGYCALRFAHGKYSILTIDSEASSPPAKKNRTKA